MTALLAKLTGIWTNATTQQKMILLAVGAVVLTGLWILT